MESCAPMASALFRTGLLIGNRPVDNRPQDAILPHGGDRYFAAV
jgi:hypothetical protein